VSVNIMLGPGPSSVATLVIGTGLEENFGWEAWREMEGRSEVLDCGRLDRSFGSVLFGSLIEERLMAFPSDSAFKEVARLETEGGFLLSSGLTLRVNARSGAGAAGSPVVETVVIDSEGRGLREGGCGIRTSLSPVDFLDGGGPLIVSP